MIELALLEPEIPQNTGTLIRLCACFSVKLHIIEPCGFLWKDKKLYRSVMDYEQLCIIERHLSFNHFQTYIRQNQKRLILIDVQGKQACWSFDYQRNDILLMGKESTGIPGHIKQSIEQSVFIPQTSGRSLNLAVAASIVIAEAVRQLLPLR
jgi:tRNA (cytidine/uridine-2'-O-)-methyltransferase